MTLHNVKPIRFNSWIGKKKFLVKNKNNNPLFQSKNNLVFTYNINDFKNKLKNGLTSEMNKNNASFFIISSRQYIFIYLYLVKFNFKIINFEMITDIMNNEIEDCEVPLDLNYRNKNLLFDFFKSKNNQINSMTLRNENKEQFIFRSNGVISYKNMTLDKFKKYFVKIDEAYEESQK
ncbi:hypothetical protein [Apilactobacillus micheneri]|uniref:hypothetical protein n=1 Tax=Apilactobacillus micheneri TaxID=1899430 RepID=UPI001125D42A|nr:hypothetical protein [Apilactobacillus micheneri]TPR50746.1 hypothetical protein DY126_06775 [Apilactobacillus micheneri]